jgi:glycosyltransferase involved in cell wall biosynthesis
MQPLASGVITNSTLLRDDYARWLDVPAAGIHVCANGVDCPTIDDAHRASDRFRIRARFQIAEDSVVLLNVGRFSPEKGQMMAMQANVRLFSRYGARVVWLLCGDGPCLDDVRRYVAERGMSNVVFTGRVDEVGAYLAAADVFVMPSDFEGMPNAMMEAMAYGLPCVSTNRSGAVDIARDGVEALYCDPGAAEELADRVMALVDDPERRARIGRNARERLREFSVSRAAQAFDACLQDMIGPSPIEPVAGAVWQAEAAPTPRSERISGGV